MGPCLQITIFALLAHIDLPTSRAKVADAASGEGGLSDKVRESVPVSRNKNSKTVMNRLKTICKRCRCYARLKHPCRENSSWHGNTYLRVFASDDNLMCSWRMQELHDEGSQCQMAPLVSQSELTLGQFGAQM